MPSKQRPQARRGRKPRAITKFRSATILRHTSTPVNVQKPPARSQSARAKALHVLSDLRRDPKLTFTQAAKNREVSPRSIRKYIEQQLRQERPGGRIRVTQSDRLRATLHIPSTKPDVLIPIHTRSSRERHLVGEWLASIKEAGRGDFARLNRFPKGTFVDGVRLPTGAYEVQRVLEAMENSESPFEQLYAMAGAA